MALIHRIKQETHYGFVGNNKSLGAQKSGLIDVFGERLIIVKVNAEKPEILQQTENYQGMAKI